MSCSGDKFSSRFVLLFFVLNFWDFSSPFLMLFTQRWHFMRFKQDKIFVICEYKLSETSRSVRLCVIKWLHDCIQPFSVFLFFNRYGKFKVVYYGLLSVKASPWGSGSVNLGKLNINYSNTQIQLFIFVHRWQGRRRSNFRKSLEGVANGNFQDNYCFI